MQKLRNGDTDTDLTYILYLAPNTISGYNTCSHATPGCIASCLFTAGRGAMNTVMQARIRKTKLFFENHSDFMSKLHNDLTLFNTYCIDNNIQGYVRLNGTSDISWENYSLFNEYPKLKFYDYTKIHSRSANGISNYHLTYSRGETTSDVEINTAIQNKMNVAVVFDELPITWKTHKVEEGDISDMRWNDTQGVIIGLKAKGMAKKDTSGFVVRLKTV